MKWLLILTPRSKLMLIKVWCSHKPWTEDYYNGAKARFEGLQESAFDTWDESRLRNFLVEQGLVEPKGPREQLVLAAKKQYVPSPSSLLTLPHRRRLGTTRTPQQHPPSPLGPPPLHPPPSMVIPNTKPPSPLHPCRRMLPSPLPLSRRRLRNPALRWPRRLLPLAPTTLRRLPSRPRRRTLRLRLSRIGSWRILRITFTRLGTNLFIASLHEA